MEVARLQWDSAFFGFPVGQVSIDSKSFDSVEFQRAAKPFRLVYVKSKAPLDYKPLRCGDAKLVFGKVPGIKMKQSDVVEATAADYHDLRKIGVQSGAFSRFALDRGFPQNSFVKLYHNWVKGSLEKQLAYKVLMVKGSRLPEGLITLCEEGRNQSNIGLFAVDEENRGKGIGRMLLEAAEGVSYLRGDQLLTVATQAKNKLACAVYNRYGFSIIQETYIYNYWNETITVQ